MTKNTDKAKAEGKPELPTEHDCPKCQQHFSDCICDDQPQGNKASIPELINDAIDQVRDLRSPLPHITDANGNPTHNWRTSQKWAQVAGEYKNAIETIEGERDHYKAHADRISAVADKLAEALGDCITSPGALAERSHEYALRRLKTITDTASEALAAWEGEK